MKDKNYITWDQYYMGVAELSSLRSKDPNTKVGACIVKDSRIVGIGYNGLPNGCSDDEFPWENKGSFEETKYPYVVHAEANAIINSTTTLLGAKIYVNQFPCNECTKLIIQAGIKEILYCESKYVGSEQTNAAMRMLKAANIKLTKIDASNVIKSA